MVGKTPIPRDSAMFYRVFMEGGSMLWFFVAFALALVLIAASREW